MRDSQDEFKGKKENESGINKETVRHVKDQKVNVDLRVSDEHTSKNSCSDRLSISNTVKEAQQTDKKDKATGDRECLKLNVSRVDGEGSYTQDSANLGLDAYNEMGLNGPASIADCPEDLLHQNVFDMGILNLSGAKQKDFDKYAAYLIQEALIGKSKGNVSDDYDDNTEPEYVGDEDEDDCDDCDDCGDCDDDFSIFDDESSKLVTARGASVVTLHNLISRETSKKRIEDIKNMCETLKSWSLSDSVKNKLDRQRVSEGFKTLLGFIRSYKYYLDDVVEYKKLIVDSNDPIDIKIMKKRRKEAKKILKSLLKEMKDTVYTISYIDESSIFD